MAACSSKPLWMLNAVPIPLKGRHSLFKYLTLVNQVNFKLSVYKYFGQLIILILNHCIGWGSQGC